MAAAARSRSKPEKSLLNGLTRQRFTESEGTLGILEGKNEDVDDVDHLRLSDPSASNRKMVTLLKDVALDLQLGRFT